MGLLTLLSRQLSWGGLFFLLFSEVLYAQGTVLQAGVLEFQQKERNQWQSYTFDQTFDNPPVVILGPASGSGPHPITLQVRNITTTGFEFQLQEWEYLDGPHMLETVTYLALAEGTHDLGGLKWQAGRTTLSNASPVQVAYPQSHSSQPVALSQVEVDGSLSPVEPRISQVNTSGFTIQVQAEESGTVAVTYPIDIGWVSLDQGLVVHGTTEIEIGMSGVAAVTGDWTELDFSGTEVFPAFLAGMQTMNDGEPGSLRMQRLRAGGVDVRVHEDQSTDAEQEHGGETVGFLRLAPLGSTAEADAMMEFGELSLDASGPNDWVTVPFELNTHEDPIVIAGIPTSNDPEPALVRIRNVTKTSFQIQLREWKYQDGAHGAETVYYLVMEKGVYNIGGKIWEVGKANIKARQWVDVPFQTSNFGDAPVVLASVFSHHGPDPVTYRLKEISNTGFKARLYEEEAEGPHTVETISYIAIEPGEGNLASIYQYKAWQGNQVNQNWAYEAFNMLADGEFAFGGFQTTAGADTIVARSASMGPDGMFVRVQEETSADAETTHVMETYGGLVIGAFDPNPPGTGELIDWEQLTDLESSGGVDGQIRLLRNSGDSNFNAVATSDLLYGDGEISFFFETGLYDSTKNVLVQFAGGGLRWEGDGRVLVAHGDEVDWIEVATNGTGLDLWRIVRENGELIYFRNDTEVHRHDALEATEVTEATASVFRAGTGLREFRFDALLLGEGDEDYDGLSNHIEHSQGTDPFVSDSDGDNLNDGDEVLVHETDPLVADTDGDSYNDGIEVSVGSDPLSAASHPGDLDGDGFSNVDETTAGSDPLDPSSTPDDHDGDGFSNSLENTAGSDPEDPSSTPITVGEASDQDYDRLGSVQEASQNTSPTVTWSYELVSGDFGSLNELGQLARVTEGTGELRLEIWERATGWSDSYSLGTGGALVSQSGGTIVQNAEGLVAAIVHPQSSSSVVELRVKDAQGQVHVHSLGELSQYQLLKVTSSGRIYGCYEDNSNQWWGFQWWNGNLSLLENPGGDLELVDGNERGEMIAHFGSTGMVWDGIAWQDLQGKALALNNHGQVLVGSGNAYLWESGVSTDLGVSVEIGADGTWHLNDLGQVLLSDINGSGSATFISADGVVTDISAPTGGAYPQQTVVGLALNDVGEAVGYLFDDSGTVTDSGGTIPLPEQGFVWKLGTFSVNGGFDLNSKVLALTNSGRMVVESFDVSQGVVVPHTGLYIPLNDLDEDGMPDDWELAFSLSDPEADPDGDGLSNLGEYLHFGNPNDSDSDNDQIIDGWEVSYGFDPAWDGDASSDLDEDGLLLYQEALTGSDPFDADTDDDGLSDGYEFNHELDPTDPSDGLSDSDEDGLTLAEEVELGTDPDLADTDGDGWTDGYEESNGYNANNPSDGLHDADSDGLSAAQEQQNGTDPENPDTDGDGQSDQEEMIRGTDPNDEEDLTNYRIIDSDSDKLTDWQELMAGTDPFVVDTDGDSLTDYEELRVYLTHPLLVDSDGDRDLDKDEIAAGTDPLNRDDTIPFEDADNDGLSDLDEALLGTDPNNFDSDMDDVPDGWEVRHNFDPNDSSTPSELVDSDGDGLTDYWEYNEYGTDPRLVDTDRDGLSDREEIEGVIVYGYAVWDYDYDGELDFIDEENTVYTDPTNLDTDGDLVPDGAELAYSIYYIEPDYEWWSTLDPSTDGDGTYDEDLDWLTLGQEFLLGLDPMLRDTDGDGISDSLEHPQDVAIDIDYDGDGVRDGVEVFFAMDRLTPGDGMSDRETDDLVAFMEEITRSYLGNQDSDGDGLTDGEEIWGYQTDPTSADTDGDGLSDISELLAGTDPTNDQNDTSLAIIQSYLDPIPGSPFGLSYQSLGIGNGIEAFQSMNDPNHPWEPILVDPPLTTNPTSLEVHTRLENLASGE